MVGTTRPRISFFMNKFRKLGFIDYNGHIRVHSALLSVVLRDQGPATKTFEHMVNFEQLAFLKPPILAE